jgi:uncharacterized protein YndB with AHSA1/START domain
MDPTLEPSFDANAPDDRRLTIVREFAAPRELVWRAFTDPYHLAQWWGPAGYTNPVCEIDLRAGGSWRNVMRAPDGRELPVDSIYIEVSPPERLVYRNKAPEGAAFGANPPPSFVRVISFADLGGRTRVTLEAYFDTAAQKDATVRRGFAEGTRESFDKLDAWLVGAPRQTSQPSPRKRQ